MTARFRALVVAASLAITLIATAAYAAKDDYIFEPVAVEVRNGSGTECKRRSKNPSVKRPIRSVAPE